MKKSIKPSYCGYIAIIGRPNVGKSTLLNYILQQKLSITSRKPQTTQNRILGIKTTDNMQAIYLDTPGIHKTKRHKTHINHSMNKEAFSTLQDVDIIIFMCDRLIWNDEDEMAFSYVKQQKKPTILVINKVDLLPKKEVLIPWLSQLSKKMNFEHIIPLSILKSHNLMHLEKSVHCLLPMGHHHFDDDQITDRSSRFLAAEMIREKIIRQIGNEIPYQTTVSIDLFSYEEKMVTIQAFIFLERKSQKKILIGKNGMKLKNIGQQARCDIEKLLGKKVMLRLWIKTNAKQKQPQID